MRTAHNVSPMTARREGRIVVLLELSPSDWIAIAAIVANSVTAVAVALVMRPNQSPDPEGDDDESSTQSAPNRQVRGALLSVEQ